MKKIMSFAWLFLAGGLSVFTPLTQSQTMAPLISHLDLINVARKDCITYQGLKLNLVISFKPGGGYDLMARALVPFLNSHSGMSVTVSNVTGGNGALAIRSVVNVKKNRPVIGILDLSSFATQTASGQEGDNLKNLIGLGILSVDSAVWITRRTINWSDVSADFFTGASTVSPYVRLGMPAQLMGLNVKPIFGMQGSNELWLSLLRDDVDIITMSDQTAKRNLATGSNAVVSLVITNKPHADFPGVAYLAGKGGILDLRSTKLKASERERLMSLGELAVMLSETTRTLVASSKLQPDMLTCFRSASQAALLDPEFAEAAKRQKFFLNQGSAELAQSKMQNIEQALQRNQQYLRSIANAWKEAP